MEQLEALMRIFGKSPTEVVELLRHQNSLSNGYSPPGSSNVGNLVHPVVAPNINNRAHHLQSTIITPNVSPTIPKQSGAQQALTTSSPLGVIGGASSTSGLMPSQISSSTSSFSSIPSMMSSSNTMHYASSSSVTYHHSPPTVIPSTSAPATIMMNSEKEHQQQHHAGSSMMFTHQDPHISAMHSHHQQQQQHHQHQHHQDLSQAYMPNMVAMTGPAATTASSSMMDTTVFSSESVDQRNVDALEPVARKQRCLEHHQQHQHSPSLWNHDRRGTGGNYQMSAGGTVVASTSALTSSTVAELPSQQPPIHSFGGALDSLLNFSITASNTAPPMSHPEYKI